MDDLAIASRFAAGAADRAATATRRAHDRAMPPAEDDPTPITTARGA